MNLHAESFGEAKHRERRIRLVLPRLFGMEIYLIGEDSDSEDAE